MITRNFQIAEDNIMDEVRANGGTMVIDFRKEDVVMHVVRTLNKLAIQGQLSKTTSADGLVHTFSVK